MGKARLVQSASDQTGNGSAQKRLAITILSSRYDTRFYTYSPPAPSTPPSLSASNPARSLPFRSRTLLEAVVGDEELVHHQDDSARNHHEANEDPPRRGLRRLLVGEESTVRICWR